jgi:RHS repeat-associated protein
MQRAFVVRFKGLPATTLLASLVSLLLATSCASPAVSTSALAQVNVASATFYHNGFGPGPVAFTNSDGSLLEERSHEPFGVPIIARIRVGTGYVTGLPDQVARDQNVLGKRTDASTGWSDHGARWMAPECAHWLSPDPPVAAPDDAFMEVPWTLHPYQYVHQNPIAYWDPTGNDGLPVAVPAKPVWSPPIRTPAPYSGAAAGARSGGSLARAARITPVGAAATILLSPSPLADGTCNAPGTCGAPGDDDHNERRRRPVYSMSVRLTFQGELRQYLEVYDRVPISAVRVFDAVQEMVRNHVNPNDYRTSAPAVEEVRKAIVSLSNLGRLGVLPLQQVVVSEPFVARPLAPPRLKNLPATFRIVVKNHKGMTNLADGDQLNAPPPL